MRLNSSIKMTKGSVRRQQTYPRRDTLEVERSAPKQTTREEDTSPDSADQLVHARAALEHAAAALAPLSAEARAEVFARAGAEVCAFATVAVVLRRTHRDLTPKEAAGRAGCSTATVLRWIARFGIGRRVGGRYVVDAARLDAFLAGGAR